MGQIKGETMEIIQKQTEEAVKSMDEIRKQTENAVKSTDEIRKPTDDTIIDTIIEGIDIMRTFKMGEVEVRALRSVNVRIRRGEFIVIMGPSG